MNASSPNAEVKATLDASSNLIAGATTPGGDTLTTTWAASAATYPFGANDPR